MHTCAHADTRVCTQSHLSCPDRPPTASSSGWSQPRLLLPPATCLLLCPLTPQGCHSAGKCGVWRAAGPSTQRSHRGSPAGHYCPAGTPSALPCPEGALNPRGGALSPGACQPCPVGTYCPGEGNAQPEGRCQHPAQLCPAPCPASQGPQQSPAGRPALGWPPVPPSLEPCSPVPPRGLSLRAKSRCGLDKSRVYRSLRAPCKVG